MQVGFLVRIEGQRLSADLEECYPDYDFAFEAEDDGVRGMYYRCGRTRELQAEFGDMLHRIHDLEASQLCSSTPGAMYAESRQGLRRMGPSAIYFLT